MNRNEIVKKLLERLDKADDVLQVARTHAECLLEGYTKYFVCVKCKSVWEEQKLVEVKWEDGLCPACGAKVYEKEDD